MVVVKNAVNNVKISYVMLSIVLIVQMINMEKCAKNYVLAIVHLMKQECVIEKVDIVQDVRKIIMV